MSFLLKPDDVVLIDDPCYFNFHALLKVHQVKVIGIPYTPNGPDLEAFKEAIEIYNPRLYITNSGIHNPTGATLSLSTAHQLLKLIDQSNLIVIEDDIFSDFEYTPAPRLAALDNLSRVIFIEVSLKRFLPLFAAATLLQNQNGLIRLPI